MVSRTQAKVSDQGCSAASSGARWVSLRASGCWAVPLVVQGPPRLAGAEGPPAAPAHVRGLPASLWTLLGCGGCCLYFTLFFSSSSHVIISNGSFEFSPSVSMDFPRAFLRFKHFLSKQHAQGSFELIHCFTFALTTVQQLLLWFAHT